MQFNATNAAVNTKLMESANGSLHSEEIQPQAIGATFANANEKLASSTDDSTTSSRRTSSRARDSIMSTRESVKSTFKSSNRKESDKIFRKIDHDNSKGASKGEIYNFVSSNDMLWALLSDSLNFPERECRKIATRVAMELASGLKGQEAMEAEINKDQFHSFRKRYMLDSKGTQAFFHRAVFAAFDRDGNGELDSDELDDFLDIFYQSDSFKVFAGDVEELPPKDYLKRAILEKFDEDGNGTLDYEEIRSIITGKAVAATAEMATKAVQADEVDRRLGKIREGSRASAHSEQEATARQASTRSDGDPSTTTTRSASRERRDAARRERKMEGEQQRKLEEIRLEHRMEEELMLASIDAARRATEERLAIEKTIKRSSWFRRRTEPLSPSLNMPYTFQYDTARRISKLWC